MKRFLSLFFIVALITVVVACQSTGGTDAGADTEPADTETSEAAQEDAGDATDVSGEVRVIVAGGQLEDGIDPLTRKETIGLQRFFDEVFSEQYPNIDVKLSVAPWENATEKMRTLLSSGDIDVLAAGGNEAAFYGDGLLREIDDLLEQDSEFKPEELYIEGLWEDSVFNKSLEGKRFGLPSAMGQRMIIYDKKLFDDWGVPYLSEHPTPEEVLEKAKQMTGKNPKTGEQNYGLWFEGGSPSGSLFVTLSYYFNAPGYEGSLQDHKEIDWQLDTDEMVELMEWLEEASTLANPAFVNNAGNEKFGTEDNDTAIYLEYNGATIIAEHKVSGDKDMIERFVPVLNFGPNGEGWVANDNISMAKEPQDLEAAWEVMKFMAGYEYSKWNYENNGVAPTLKDPDFIDPEDIYLEKALEIAQYGHVNIKDSVQTFFSSEINPAINGFVSSAAEESAPDINDFLNDLQEKAMDWSAMQ